ncbi:efflux RND transporter permease subunit [Leptospira sp. WS39.C2]
MKLIEGMVQFFQKHNRLCWVGIIFMFFSVFSQLEKFQFQLLPNLSPTLYFITITYPNHSAEDVDKAVSFPLSNRISSVKSVKQIRTKSVHGKSTIQIYLQKNASLLDFKENLYQLLYEVKDELPHGIGIPKVQIGNEYQNPFFEFTVQKKNLYTKDEDRYLLDQLKYKLERVSGVVEVKRIGDTKTSFVISLYEKDLNNYPIQLKEIEFQISSALQSGSLGKIVEYGQETEIKFDPEIESLSELKKFPIHLGNGNFIPLEKIASVTKQSLQIDQMINQNGLESVYFAIYVDPNKDPLKLSKQIEFVISEYHDRLNPIVFYDASVELKDQINQFLFFLFLSLVCALSFSYFLYKEWFPVFCLLVSVTITLMLCFHFMVLFSISLNLLSLSGISVGIGMLFDANNLIYYSIRKQVNSSQKLPEIVLKGIRSVIVSLFSSGLTTMVVIVPLLLYAHEWKEFFYDIGLCIVLLIFSSLLVSVTIIPFLFLSFSPNIFSRISDTSNQIVRVKKWNALVSHKYSMYLLLVLLVFLLIIRSYPFQFQIFPKPKPIGTRLLVTPQENINIKEEMFLISKIREIFNVSFKGTKILILSEETIDESEFPHQAMPFVIKWFHSKELNKEDLNWIQEIDKTRWKIQTNELQSHLAQSLPFLPMDSVIIMHENWETLMVLLNDYLSLPTKEGSEGGFSFIPTPIKMKVWKPNLVLEPDLQPDMDDLSRKILYRNSSKYLGSIGAKNRIPLYLGIKSEHQNDKFNKSILLPNFKSKTKDTIFPDSLFQTEERDSFSEYRRESGSFYLEWVGILGVGEFILKEKEKGFRYQIHSEKKEISKFYNTLVILLVCSFVFIYLSLVAIYESFFRPAFYLSVSILYSICVLFFLILLLPEIHFGHYMGLVILIGLSIDSISLFGERWDEFKSIGDKTERINSIFNWFRKPFLLNSGSTFFGLVPVVLIEFPGSEFIRAIAITMCIGIIVSYVFVFQLYPKIFSKYYDSRI